MKILLTGATGFIGRNLSQVLTAAGHQVIPASRRNGTLDLVGPRSVAFADWLQLMREARGMARGRLLQCPVSLALAFANLGRWISPMLHPDTLRMLLAGSVADCEPLVRWLGRLPMAVEPRLFFCDAAEVQGWS